MAKLNVKFLEVTNGEVEKVEVNGVAYVKTTDEVKQGDLLLMQEEGCDIDEGAFYEVTEIDSADDPQFLDNVNDEADGGAFDYEVFKREVPAKKAGLNVGDKVRITGTEKTREVMGSHHYNIGDIVTVKDVIGTYEDRIRVLAKDESWGKVVHVEDFEVVDENALVFEELGRKVGELKDGDIVQVVKDSAGHKVGTIGFVVGGARHVDDVHVRANGISFYETVKLIAPVEHLANEAE